MVDETNKAEEKADAEPHAEGKKEEKEEVTTAAGAGDVVARAEAAAKLMKEQNDRAEIIFKKNEAIAAKVALGGRSGFSAPAEKKEETDAEYSDRVMAGKV